MIVNDRYIAPVNSYYRAANGRDCNDPSESIEDVSEISDTYDPNVIQESPSQRYQSNGFLSAPLSPNDDETEEEEEDEDEVDVEGWSESFNLTNRIRDSDEPSSSYSSTSLVTFQEKENKQLSTLHHRAHDEETNTSEKNDEHSIPGYQTLSETQLLSLSKMASVSHLDPQFLGDESNNTLNDFYHDKRNTLLLLRSSSSGCSTKASSDHEDSFQNNNNSQRHRKSFPIKNEASFSYERQLSNTSDGPRKPCRAPSNASEMTSTLQTKKHSSPSNIYTSETANGLYEDHHNNQSHRVSPGSSSLRISEITTRVSIESSRQKEKLKQGKQRRGGENKQFDQQHKQVQAQQVQAQHVPLKQHQQNQNKMPIVAPGVFIPGVDDADDDGDDHDNDDDDNDDDDGNQAPSFSQIRRNKNSDERSCNRSCNDHNDEASVESDRKFHAATNPLAQYLALHNCDVNYTDTSCDQKSEESRFLDQLDQQQQLQSQHQTAIEKQLQKQKESNIRRRYRSQSLDMTYQSPWVESKTSVLLAQAMIHPTPAPSVAATTGSDETFAPIPESMRFPLSNDFTLSPERLLDYSKPNAISRKFREHQDQTFTEGNKNESTLHSIPEIHKNLDKSRELEDHSNNSKQSSHFSKQSSHISKISIRSQQKASSPKNEHPTSTLKKQQDPKKSKDSHSSRTQQSPKEMDHDNVRVQTTQSWEKDLGNSKHQQKKISIDQGRRSDGKLEPIDKNIGTTIIVSKPFGEPEGKLHSFDKNIGTTIVVPKDYDAYGSLSNIRRDVMSKQKSTPTLRRFSTGDYFHQTSMSQSYHNNHWPKLILPQAQENFMPSKSTRRLSDIQSNRIQSSRRVSEAPFVRSPPARETPTHEKAPSFRRSQSQGFSIEEAKDVTFAPPARKISDSVERTLRSVHTFGSRITAPNGVVSTSSRDDSSGDVLKYTDDEDDYNDENDDNVDKDYDNDDESKSKLPLKDLPRQPSRVNSMSSTSSNDKDVVVQISNKNKKIVENSTQYPTPENDIASFYQMNHKFDRRVILTLGALLGCTLLFLGGVAGALVTVIVLNQNHDSTLDTENDNLPKSSENVSTSTGVATTPPSSISTTNKKTTRLLNDRLVTLRFQNKNRHLLSYPNHRIHNGKRGLRGAMRLNDSDKEKSSEDKIYTYFFTTESPNYSFN